MMRLFIYFFFIVVFSFKVNSETINKIEIEGNNRISNSNIILFGKITLNEDYDNNKINITLKTELLLLLEEHKVLVLILPKDF